MPREDFRFLRTCYDHPAGKLAVQLHDALLRAGWLEAVEGEYRITAAGAPRLAAFGVDLRRYPKRRRIAGPCLDGTEKKHHLGGALGAALLRRFEELGWTERAAGSRVLRLTVAGADGLQGWLGIRARADEYSETRG